MIDIVLNTYYLISLYFTKVNLLIGNVDGAVANFKKAVELNENFPIAVVQKCYTDYR